MPTSYKLIHDSYPTLRQADLSGVKASRESAPVLTWSDFTAVWLEELHSEGAVLLLRLKAEAGVLVQQHMRICIVYRV